MTWQSVFQQLNEGATFPSPHVFAKFVLDLLQSRFLHYYEARVQCQKRSLKREEPLELVQPEPESHEAGPVEEAIAHEEWQRMLDRAPVAVKPLLEALRNGHSTSKVAAMFGIKRRTVERLRERMRYAQPA